MAPKNTISRKSDDEPPRKNIANVKHKYSPLKKLSSKHNIVYVQGFKFGLMTLTLKKGHNPTEDAFINDFLEKLDSEPNLSEVLGILRASYIRDSNKCDLPRIQSNGYKAKQILGIAPEGKEDNAEYRKVWADKIIDYLNTSISWKYENVFRFRADITKYKENKVSSSLDDVLLDEDIGGFVGTYLYDDINNIKDNNIIMSNIFGNEENKERGDAILLANWNHWLNDD
jgi:hypothetical protein